MRQTILRVHKWVAVTTGLVLLMWIASGVVLLVPPPTPNILLPFERAAQQATRADITRALTALDSGSTIDRVQIRSLLGRRVLEVRGERGVNLLDGESGAPLNITSDIARAIAAEQVDPTVSITGITRLEEHDLGYPFGPLPVFRVTFDDGARTLAYVNVTTGGVVYADRFTRAWYALTSMHDFTALVVLVKSVKLRHGLLWLLAGGVGLVALSGYYLALPKRWTRARRSTA